MHDIAVDMLGRPHEGVDFDRTLVHEFDNCFFHLFVAFGPPASDPVQEVLLHLGIGKLDLDRLGKA